MTNDQTFSVGDKVKLVESPSYIKTAEPMPMLRPPNVVKVGEEGTILDRRPGDYWAVRFKNGAFLLESRYLEVVSSQENASHVDSNSENN
ncbi:regulatory protein SipA [Dactylococcopsis salina]|uniref:DUF3148 domain-containing protein n=1 Tax=Dactylococcopsis salina (strain PCC 8305) TaxID=13035 RepID=K9Z000_DACS8|nr:DUF3148 domain-containing protein [Dactylococcopsis salina]AFZ51895.1 Protein of unknown function (DUF3148) [Dactylococcopsis salina PCC 8305]